MSLCTNKKNLFLGQDKAPFISVRPSVRDFDIVESDRIAFVISLSDHIASNNLIFKVSK